VNTNRITINLIAQILMFFSSLLINFFLTHFITKTLGVEAYGFTALASQLINIFNLFVISLNSMAGRFITISIHQKRIDHANKYFSSILISNWIFVAIFLIPALVSIIFLEKFISIPSNLIYDIKILYLILFINYFLGLLFSTFSISTFIVNKIYLSSLRSLESSLLKMALLLVLYYILPPYVFYLGLATLIANLYGIFFNILLIVTLYII
jgi:Na+-driven multidrug efflux pump